MLTISVAATQLGCTPRMLRYRERLGLLPAARHGKGEHRRYGEPQLRAAVTATAVEKSAGVGPAELAFAIRVLADPVLATAVREVARQAGRLPAEPIAALDFDRDKARRLLRPSPSRPGPSLRP